MDYVRAVSLAEGPSGTPSLALRINSSLALLAGLDALSQPRIATAIKHCLDSGARVISCSLGPCTSLDHGAGNCQSWTVLDSVLEIGAPPRARRSARKYYELTADGLREAREERVLGRLLFGVQEAVS